MPGIRTPSVVESTLKNSLTAIAQYQWVIWLIVVLVRGVVFTMVVPPWQHPDEPTHFEHVRMIAEMGRLPELNDVNLSIRRDIAQSMLRNQFWRDLEPPQLDDDSLSKVGISPLGIYTTTQPRLYYQLAAAWLVPWLTQPVETQLRLVRMLSVLCGALIVLCAFLSASWLFGRQHNLIAVVCAIIVFLPGFTDIMSAVNNDALVNLFCALFLTLFAWWFSHRVSVLSGMLVIALMVGSLAAAVATKATAIVLLASVPLGLLLVVVIWALMKAAGNRGLRKIVPLIGVTLFVIAAGVSVVMLIVVATQNVELEDWLSRYLRVNISGTLNNLRNPQLPYEQVMTVIFRSYYAVFGWRHVYVADWLYAVPMVGSLLSMLGLIAWVTWLRQQDKDVQQRLLMYAAFALVVVAVAWLAAILRSQAEQGMSQYHSHGRYAYIAIIPSSILTSLGLMGWLPASWRWRVAISLVLTMIGFDLVCFVGYLVPYYYIVPILGID